MLDFYASTSRQQATELPEEELIGVIKGLRVDAVIGLNLVEKYGIILEREKIGFKERPPKASPL